MHRLPELRFRLAELNELRSDCAAQRKSHFVKYLDRLIADVEREIADSGRRTAPSSDPERA